MKPDWLMFLDVALVFYGWGKLHGRIGPLPLCPLVKCESLIGMGRGRRVKLTLEKETDLKSILEWLESDGTPTDRLLFMAGTIVGNIYSDHGYAITNEDVIEGMNLWYHGGPWPFKKLQPDDKEHATKGIER